MQRNNREINPLQTKRINIMALTPEQKLIVDFYETIAKKLDGHLEYVQEGPIVYNFIFKHHTSKSEAFF